MFKSRITYLMDPISKKIKLDAQWTIDWLNDNCGSTLKEYKKNFIKVEIIGNECRVI